MKKKSKEAIKKAKREAQKCIKKAKKGAIEKDRATRISQVENIESEAIRDKVLEMIEEDYKKNILCYKKAKMFLEIPEVKNLN